MACLMVETDDRQLARHIRDIPEPREGTRSFGFRRLDHCGDVAVLLSHLLDLVQQNSR
jgi:hypothetical protein